MTFGIDTMGASSVRWNTRIYGTVRSLESCNLSNFDQAAESFQLLGDGSLGRERDERVS